MAQTTTFTYIALDASGNQKKGSMVGPSQAVVSDKLIELGYRPISVQEKRASLAQMEIQLPWQGRVGLKELAFFSRQFSTMINSGLPIIRSLETLANQTDNPGLRRVLSELASDVRGGESLSNAIAHHKEFPPMFVSMCQAGEVGGQLGEVLNRVAVTLEKELTLKRKVISAMSYPIMVLILSLSLTIGLLVFVMPKFQSMFDMVEGDLPALTQAMLVASDALQSYWYMMLGILAIVSLIFAKVRKTSEYRKRISPIVLRMPIFGPLLQKVAIARFSRNLGSLLRAGVSIVNALEITRGTLNQPVIEDALIPVTRSVREGEYVSTKLAENPWFPPMMVQMMAVGEETGNADVMLEKVADYFDEEVDAIADALTTAIEPMMIVILGGIVGTMVVGMYLPMFSLIGQIQG